MATDTGKNSSPKHWIPLESNPDVLNEFAAKLGIQNIPHEYQFCDIYGLDDDLLAMVPQPALAVVLLFPITDATETLRREETEACAAGSSHTPPASLFYMKQTIGNACGTIGLLHSAANATPPLNLTPGSFLEDFFTATRELTPEQRGAYLEKPPQGAPTIDSIHEEAAKKGDTAAPPAEDDVNLHFVAFVQKEGHLWELDGRKTGPVDHGASSEGTLLKDVAAVVRKNFVERAESLNFSLIALAAAPSDDDF